MMSVEEAGTGCLEVLYRGTE